MEATPGILISNIDLGKCLLSLNGRVRSDRRGKNTNIREKGWFSVEGMEVSTLAVGMFKELGLLPHDSPLDTT